MVNFQPIYKYLQPNTAIPIYICVYILAVFLNVYIQIYYIIVHLYSVYHVSAFFKIILICYIYI